MPLPAPTSAVRDLTCCSVWICSDEERSAFYEQLMAAEESGKKNKKGMHSAKDAPVHHTNDVSLPGAANRYAHIRDQGSWTRVKYA